MLATGKGLTVIVKLSEGPLQPFATGVTDIVAVVWFVVPFTTVKESISPVPEAGNPMLGLSFVQS